MTHKILGFFVPLSLVLTPLMSQPFRSIAIIFWLIFIPLYYFRISKLKNLLWFMIISMILISQSYYGLNYDFQLAILVLVPLLILAMQQFAILGVGQLEFSEFKVGIGFGAFTINVVTLILFGMVAQNFIPLDYVYTAFGNDPEFGIARFTLGNAIEVPFMMTLCTIASCHSLKSKRSSMLFMIFNLAAALLSQSRGVILISLLYFFSGKNRSSYTSKAMVTLISFVAIYIYSDITLILWDQLLLRFGGEDYGSTDSRLGMVVLLFDQITARTLLVGDGLLSSSILMESELGLLKTAESSLLQILYEFGLFVTVFLFAPIGYICFRMARAKVLVLFYFAIIAQYLFLLPITASFGLISILIVVIGKDILLTRRFTSNR